MIENPADFLPIWMLFSAAFGFIVGDALGDSRRHRKCLEQINDDLRDDLEKAHEPLYGCSNSSAASSMTSTSKSWL